MIQVGRERVIDLVIEQGNTLAVFVKNQSQEIMSTL
jgi:hypothetical protein